MKISCICESGVTRRDFLKSSGKVGLALLVSSGVSPEDAREIVSDISDHSGTFEIFQHVQDSASAFYDTADKSLKTIIAGMNGFRRDFGVDPSFATGYDSVGAGLLADKEGVVKFLARASENGWEIIPEGDGNFLLARGRDEVTVSPHDPSGDFTFSKSKNFLKDWWDGWMGNSFEVSTPSFRRVLANNGVDYWDRDGSTIELAMETMQEMDIKEFERDYGDPKNWIKLADLNKIDYPRELRKKAGLEEQYRPRPDDHIYGSSMHQPMESLSQKLAVVFGK